MFLLILAWEYLLISAVCGVGQLFKDHRLNDRVGKTQIRIARELLSMHNVGDRQFLTPAESEKINERLSALKTESPKSFFYAQLCFIGLGASLLVLTMISLLHL